MAGHALRCVEHTDLAADELGDVRRRSSRIKAKAVALAVVMMVCSCAYILHPERRGNSRGPVSGPDLVMDILWLLPGIIPGIVALTVDFSNGAIYTGGGPAHGRIETLLPSPIAATSLELRLVDGRGTVYDRDGTTLSPGDAPQALAVELSRVAQLTHGQLPRDLYLELETGEGRTASLALPPRVEAGEFGHVYEVAPMLRGSPGESGPPTR